MLIYIAGKITGDPDYPAKFSRAAELLTRQGNTPLNPANNPPGLTRAEYMRIDLGLIDAADAVCFLPDWTDSPGARLERYYCDYVGKKNYEMEDRLWQN